MWSFRRRRRSDFTLYNPSPELYPWIGNAGHCDYATYYKGRNTTINHWGFYGVGWNDKRLNLCSWTEADGKASDFEIRPFINRPMFADSDNSFNIISLPLILDVDDWSLQTSILSDPEYLSFDCLDFFRESDHAYVANSQYQVDDLDIVFGDNVPVTLFMRPRYEPCYLFVGRYGEIRTVDYANHKLSIKKDGTGRWTPFDVKEQPDKYFAKGFGAFYEGSLSQITEGAPYGWFDVRISLATAEGSTQQQVISPAFRIDDLAGIRSVGSDIQENSSVEYYNFQGIRISKPEPGMPVIERRGDSVVKTIAR